MILNNKFYINNLKHIIFFGESDVFKNLIEINNNIDLKTTIITGSHQAKIINKKINIKIFDKINENFKKFINKNCSRKSTLFVSLGARYIFKKNTINNFFLNNLVNFHGARLPLDAGGGGFSWRILREDRIDSQLVHLVDEEIDKGPVLENELNIFPKHCKVPLDFKNYYTSNFLNFYKKFVQNLKKGKKFDLKSQSNFVGRYNPRLNTKINGLIDWKLNSYDLINFINAFDEHYSGATTYLNNGNYGKLKIRKCHLHGGDSSNHPFMAGIVTRHDKKWIVVSTSGKHMLLVEEVLDSKGKNILSKIKTGDRFFTPTIELDNAVRSKVIYTSKGKKN